MTGTRSLSFGSYPDHREEEYHTNAQICTQNKSTKYKFMKYVNNIHVVEMKYLDSQDV